MLKLTWVSRRHQVDHADGFLFDTIVHVFYFNPVCCIVGGSHIQHNKRQAAAIQLTAHQLHSVLIGWMLVAWIHMPVPEVEDIFASKVRSGPVYSVDRVVARSLAVHGDILSKRSSDIFYMD